MSDRRQLYEQIQTLLAGHSVSDCIGAVCDSLASTLAFAATDRAHASTLVQSLPADLERTIDNNWTYVREVRATSQVTAGGGNA